MFVCANHSTEHHIKEKEKKTNECTTMSWKLVKNQCVDVWCFSWNYNCSIFNNAHIWVLSSKLAVLFLAERKAMKNIYLNGSVFHYVIITFDVIKWRRELSGIQWWRDFLVFCEYISFLSILTVSMTHHIIVIIWHQEKMALKHINMLSAQNISVILSQ